MLRGDGLLEEVAFTGSGSDEVATMGDSFSLSLVRRVLKEGTRYGKFVFLAEEEMDTDLQDALRGYGYVPPVLDSSDPERWRSLDMLVATLTDASGRTRALLHLDEPLSGRRPTPAQLHDLTGRLELVLQAVLATVDREELTLRARLDETARAVVRAASLRLGGGELLAQVHPELDGRLPRPFAGGVAVRRPRRAVLRLGRRRGAARPAASRHRGSDPAGVAVPHRDHR